MASKFDAMVAGDTQFFMGEFGENEPVKVTPYGKAQREIKAIVLREMRMPEAEFQGRNVFNTIEIYVSSRNDVEGLVNPKELKTPGQFDTFEFDGITWGLRRVLERNIGGMHKLLLWDGGSGTE